MIEDMEYVEGETPLDPDEMDGLRFSHITTRGQLNELEQANIDDGELWLKRQKKLDILSDQFVRTLHKKLFGKVWSWAGTYRRTEKNVGVDPVQIAVSLRHLLDDTQYWVENEVYSPIEAAARFHHRLVQIHPFANGNGRHARIMADLVMTQLYGEAAIDWSGDADLQKESVRRNEYIRALRAADGGNYKPLFEFVGLYG
ncbi:MAG: mobile mystery protein B [Porticoccaceae bacterium]